MSTLLLAELKARVADPDAVRARLQALGAVRERAVTQRDTFFHVARGRLKLREEDGATRLIYYERDDVADAKASHVRLAPVTDPAALRTLLADALGTRTVVTKRREIWRWDGAEVRLDEVAGLGSFLEFLEEVGDDARMPSALAHLRDLIRRLGIAAPEIQSRSYVDLLARP